MDLTLDPSHADGYKSKAQRSRVITEAWAEANLYCLACGADDLDAHRPGKKVEDFLCPACDRRTQLKAKRGGHGRKVANSAYGPKMERVRANSAPDYAFMGFDPNDWHVDELFVVPGHFLTASAIERRKPLRSSARRAGWVGSNILLDRIPKVGKVHLVREREVVPRRKVLEVFREAAFLERRDAESRGWLSDVWACVDKLDVAPGESFALSDVYAFEQHLSKLHPDNNHVRAKIRQQLQVLRDEGRIEFLGGGEYRLLPL